jgi:hypothetical protein
MMSQQSGGMDFNQLMQRLRRLVTLDTSVFDEIRTDTAATIPAAIVAVVSVVLFALGGWLWWIVEDFGRTGRFFVESVVVGSILAIILWAVWVGITYVVLTQVFRARADINELLRVMGFAAAPLALGLLFFIPAIGFGIAFAVLALFFGAHLIAVQSATDADAGKVLIATAAGFAVWAIVLGLLSGDDSTWTPNIFIYGWFH